MSVHQATPTGAAAMPFSTYLFEQVGPAVDSLCRRRTAQNWDPADHEVLRRCLLLVWQAVKASAPLLDCAGQVVRDSPSGRFNDLLYEYYMLHAVEERGHDEWLLDDLAVLGVRRDLAHLELPNRHIAAMVGSQYYLIRHYHPALLLGYLAFCEGHPPRRESIELLRVRSATSPAAWRTYFFHAEVDPLHLEELRSVLDEVPGEPRPLREAIVVNALRCVASYAAALDSVFRPVDDAPAARAPP